MLLYHYFRPVLQDPSEGEFIQVYTCVLRPDAFQAFLCGNIFAKTGFCLGERRGVLVNDECTVALGTIE